MLILEIRLETNECDINAMSTSQTCSSYYPTKPKARGGLTRPITLLEAFEGCLHAQINTWCKDCPKEDVCLPLTTQSFCVGCLLCCTMYAYDSRFQVFSCLSLSLSLYLICLFPFLFADFGGVCVQRACGTQIIGQNWGILGSCAIFLRISPIFTPPHSDEVLITHTVVLFGPNDDVIDIRITYIPHISKNPFDDSLPYRWHTSGKIPIGVCVQWSTLGQRNHTERIIQIHNRP